MTGQRLGRAGDSPIVRSDDASPRRPRADRLKPGKLLPQKEMGVMKQMIEISALAVCLAVSPIGLAAAHPRRPRRPEYRLLHRNDEAASVKADLSATRQPARPAPDWTVQYGEIDGGASGSIGAMLAGQNPAANAVP